MATVPRALRDRSALRYIERSDLGDVVDYWVVDLFDRLVRLGVQLLDMTSCTTYLHIGLPQVDEHSVSGHAQ
jgi:hypothetical protein